MGTSSKRWNRLGVLLASALVAAALPAVSPVPYSGYPPAPDPYPQTYAPSYPAPEYQPSYPAPEYQPSYPAPAYAPSYPAPEYQPSYPAPAYTPSYPAPAYTPSYPAPAYAPTYQPSYPQPVQYTEYDSYEAVTYLEVNASIHCGVLPSTNDELYLDNSLYQQQQYGYGPPSYDLQPVNPFAKSRWVVLITDDYYNYVCTGVIVNNYFVLTAASCINGPLDKYRVRLGDWDILTDYNEYEAYKNFEARICKKFPVKSESYGSYSPPPSYGYQQDYADLVLLEVDNEFDYDKYPQVAPICLPVYPSYYPPPSYTPPYNPPAYNPPAYNPPAYNPPAYNPPAYPSAYPAQPYVAPSYTPSYPAPSYYQPPTYYSECWVVGWYAPPTTELKNHPKPTASEEYSSNSYGSYGKSYQQPEPKYYEEYYKGYDQSRVQRKAKVKEIKCPSYGYGSQSPSYGSNSVCYVGVDGDDTCVADKGAGVYCVVDEKYYGSYDSGYSNTDSYQPNYQPSSYPSSYPSYPTPAYGYEQSYAKKEIKAIIANELPKRKRAVLVAIVQKLTQCSDNYPPPSYGGYGSNYQQPQSKPITATKVDYQTVDKIIDIFWENAYDDSCPATKSYYQEPAYQPSYPSYNPPAYPSYNPPAYPSYEPPYQSYPAVYEPSYPSYEPSYPSYEPQYPSYEPAYPSYPAPAYPAPAYNPPNYEPAYPSYPTPSYTPPPSYGYQG